MLFKVNREIFVTKLFPNVAETLSDCNHINVHATSAACDGWTASNTAQIASSTACISCYSTSQYNNDSSYWSTGPWRTVPARCCVGLLRISPNNTHHYRLLHVTQLPITLAQICFPVLGPDNDTADTVRALQMLALCSTCAGESGFEDLIYATSWDFRHSLIFQPRL